MYEGLGKALALGIVWTGPAREVQWGKGVACRVTVGHTEAQMERGHARCVVGAQSQQGLSENLLWLSTGWSLHLLFLEPRKWSQ